MDLVSSFVVLLQELAVNMSAPSLANLQTIVTGWVFARRRTITGMLVAAGVAEKRHHSAFHRLFAEAAWSLDAVGLAVFRLIEPWCGDTLLVAIDDTLARKRGLKMFGTGMHHDPLLSSRGKKITNWGHSWVVLGVIVQLPFRDGHYFCLPILFRLYLNKKRSAEHGRLYRTRPELAVQMLDVLCRHRRNRRFHAIADSAYGGQSVLCQLPENCDLTSRLVKDARLYEPPPTRKPGQTGRPRKRGERLPTPQQMLAGRCRHVSLAIYGRHQQARLADVEARVFAAPQRPLRVVAVEALRGGRGQEAFYSTCHRAAAEQVIAWYAMRWSIEVAFHDSKQHLGFEEPQGWSRRAVQRTAPMAMLLYSLIVLWFARDGYRAFRPDARPWNRGPRPATFTEMLATLRRESIRAQSLSWGLGGPGSRKILQTLDNLAALAA